MPLFEGYDEYVAGIEAAVKAGEIVFMKPEYAPLGPRDSFSHLQKDHPVEDGDQRVNAGRLLEQNTRPMDPIVQRLLHIQARISAVTMLEGGVGIGVCAYQAWKLGKETPHPITVDGLSLTPVNARATFKNLIPKNGSTALYEPTPQFLPDRYLRTQYIGSFAKDFRGRLLPIPRSYRLIHDGMGPITHGTSNPLDGYSKLLACDGIMAVSNSAAVDEFSSVREKGDAVFFARAEALDYWPAYIIWAKKKSALAQCAHKNLSQKEIEGVVESKFFYEFTDSILESPHS